jgi:hypothetical protein
VRAPRNPRQHDDEPPAPNVTRTQALAGYQGKPLIIPGPQDDAARIIKRLQRKVGRGGYHHIVPV